MHSGVPCSHCKHSYGMLLSPCSPRCHPPHNGQPPSGVMLGSTFLTPPLLPSVVPGVPGLAEVSAGRCGAVDITAPHAAPLQAND